MRVYAKLLIVLIFIITISAELYAENTLLSQTSQIFQDHKIISSPTNKNQSVYPSTPELNLSAEEKNLWNSLFYTYQLIKNSSIFTNKVSATNLLFAALDGMVSALDDPYSVMLQGQSLEQFIQNMDNHYSGIGIYIVTNQEGIKIVDVIPDSPAWLIGLKANDIITAVEGNLVAGIGIEETRTLLLGKEGSLVNISVQRGDKKIDFTVIRKDIQVKTVYPSRVGEGNQYGYIRIINFGQQTVAEFEEALIKLKNERIRGLVIDLRNNPGGLLSAVAQMINFFVAKGIVVSTQKVGSVHEEIEVRPLVLFPGFIPVVVLINKYSASASEIFAGAMRDHGRAVLVGEKSYGKFSVQQLFPIYQDPQGKNNAVLKLTIAKYFLPKGNSYEQIGISPQVPVTIPPPKNDSPAGNAEHYNLPSPHIPVSVSEPYVAEALKILVDPKLYQEYLKTP